MAGLTVRYRAEYRSWSGMRDRCANSMAYGWSSYGGVGIVVCERWRNSFAAFLEDVGPKPHPSWHLHRINPYGHYEPGNCVWMEPSEHRRQPHRPNRDNPNAMASRECAILALVATRPAGVSQREIAESLQLTRAYVSVLLQRLKGKRRVLTTDDPARRCIVVTLPQPTC